MGVKVCAAHTNHKGFINFARTLLKPKESVCKLREECRLSKGKEIRDENTSRRKKRSSQ